MVTTAVFSDSPDVSLGVEGLQHEQAPSVWGGARQPCPSSDRSWASWTAGWQPQSRTVHAVCPVPWNQVHFWALCRSGWEGGRLQLRLLPHQHQAQAARWGWRLFREAPTIQSLRAWRKFSLPLRLSAWASVWKHPKVSLTASDI